MDTTTTATATGPLITEHDPAPAGTALDASPVGAPRRKHKWLRRLALLAGLMFVVGHVGSAGQRLMPAGMGSSAAATPLSAHTVAWAQLSLPSGLVGSTVAVAASRCVRAGLGVQMDPAVQMTPSGSWTVIGAVLDRGRLFTAPSPAQCVLRVRP